MSIQCVIFDCDGTLVDSERLSMELLVQMCAENGIELHPGKTKAHFAGMRLAKATSIIAEQNNTTLPDSFIPEFRQRLTGYLQQKLQAMPHIHSVLQSLTHPRCVASNAPIEKIRLCLHSTELLEFFDGRIYSAYEVDSWKPDPGLFLAAAEGMGFPPNECLVVEDSLPGVRAGLEAGMHVIAYRRSDITNPQVLHMDNHLRLPELIESLS